MKRVDVRSAQVLPIQFEDFRYDGAITLSLDDDGDVRMSFGDTKGFTDDYAFTLLSDEAREVGKAMIEFADAVQATQKPAKPSKKVRP